MKKIFAIAAIAATVLFAGCRKTSDFNKYLTVDYEYVQAQFPGQDVVFYEAEVVLNGSPAVLGKKAQPKTVKEVYQIDTTVAFINRNYEEGTFTFEAVPGYWLEDIKVELAGIADFKDALGALLHDAPRVPDSPFVTLRKPLGPTIPENPFYIFGSTTKGFVSVDARTLEVHVVSEEEVKEPGVK